MIIVVVLELLLLFLEFDSLLLLVELLVCDEHPEPDPDEINRLFYYCLLLFLGSVDYGEECYLPPTLSSSLV